MTDPSSAAHLPVELFRLILVEVKTRHDLCTLARVCRSIQAEVEPNIYRTLSATSALDIVLLCRRILSARRLAQYVMCLNLDSHLDPPPTNLQNRVMWLTIYNILRSTLEQLTNLCDLGINVPSIFETRPGGSAYGLFARCTFRLHRFSTGFRMDEPLARFLENQPEIRDLNLRSPVSYEYLSYHSLPNLTVLRMAQLTANNVGFFSDRHVTHVKLGSMNSDIPSHLAALAQSVVAYQGSPFIFETLPSHLPHLQLISGNLDVFTTEEIPETLSKFRKLRTLVITGHHGYFQSSDPSELLAKLEEACPLLHTVAFYGRDRRWLRWEFSGSGWRKIDAAEDIDPWDQSVRDLAF